MGREAAAVVERRPMHDVLMVPVREATDTAKVASNVATPMGRVVGSVGRAAWAFS
jgi:hypothetical protein